MSDILNLGQKKNRYESGKSEEACLEGDRSIVFLTIALLQLRAPDNFSQRSNFAKLLGMLCMGTYIVLCLPAKLRHVSERLWCIVGKMAHLSSGMRKVISRIMRYLLFLFLVLVLSLMKTSRGTSKEGNSFSVSHFQLPPSGKKGILPRKKDFFRAKRLYMWEDAKIISICITAEQNNFQNTSCVTANHS